MCVCVCVCEFDCDYMDVCTVYACVCIHIPLRISLVILRSSLLFSPILVCSVKAFFFITVNI